jgi:uncharacterized membrane protein SpoIIM required for sporulation
MVWKNRVFSTLIGAATAIVFIPLSTVLILKLTPSEVVEGSCKGFGASLYAHNDCLGAAAIGWAFHIGAGCALIGVLLGAFVGVVVYRRLSAENPTSTSPIQ